MKKNDNYDRLMRCLNSVREKTDFVPRVAITLGSGLGDYAKQIKVVCEIKYADIDSFVVSTAPGHDGKLIFGYVDDVPVVCMKGRVHYYEGYSMDEVVLPARLMKLLGAETLFLTNAAGGLSYDFNVGDFMMITDHISIFMPNPLIGPNDDRFGTRFPDMTNVYDKELQRIIREAAKETGIDLKEGVYCQLTGPSFEASAEIKLLRTLGVDAVGMSTVVEAIAANHIGLKVCGISFISNAAAGMEDKPLSGNDVNEAADKSGQDFAKLVTAAVEMM